MVPILLLLPLFLLVFAPALAKPVSLPFVDCFSGNSSEKLDVSAVYGQVVPHADGKPALNLTVFGSSPVDVLGTGENLATLFSSTSILTLNAHSSSIYLCIPIRPPSPLPEPTEDINGYNNRTYCPLSAGPFGLSSSIPLGSNRALSTLTTRLRAVDPFSREILCVDVSYTPVSPGKYGYRFGEAIIIFWATVALAIAYWVLTGVARISSAWGRGIRQKHNLWARVESAGFIFASALSGEGFANSPALLRFCTPSLRDIIFHTQWCSALAMVAVQWPTFAYPILTQTAWSTLVYNITLTSPSTPHRWDALSVEPFEAPSGFADQVDDPSSSLYINQTAPNVLFRLPSNATHGMSSFAYTIGVRPEDLWSICMIIFLGIMAGAIFLSALFWLTDWIAAYISQFFSKGPNRLPGMLSSVGSKDMLDSTAVAASSATNNEESKSLNGTPLFRTTSRFTLPLAGSSGPVPGRKSWWRARPAINSFHTNVLHGNLVRIIILFHLPVTIFSCYEMTRPKSIATTSSIALAGLSFAIFSVLIPIALVVRVKLTNTSKLYDETRTLLAFGPLYNHYRHGSQMFATLFFASNLVFGIAIGCGQNSGTAQAIVILVVEVISALVTSIWLPWGHGASMGLISFLFCVGRIVVAVLVVILAPAISIGPGPSGWVAYGILVILGLVFLALVLMFATKIIEAIVRIIGGISFDSSTHVVDSGLLGAFGLLGCCGGRRRRPKSKARIKYRSTARDPPSDGAFYPPSRAETGRDKESVHSVPTPSVLRPEQAMRPYQEDRDDENGFIMGAWRGAQGYQHIGTSSPASSKPSSGFSRIGGGRAHFDSPYSAIPPQNQGTSTPLKQSTIFHQDDDEANTIPFNSRAEPAPAPVPAPVHVPVRMDNNNDLPPGAMKPLHARTRSQTAIIEDAGSYLGAIARTEEPKPPHPPSSFNNGEDKKSRSWFNLRRNRPHSAGDDSSSAPAEELPLSEPVGSTSGRSFVVIRDKKPQEPRQRQVSDVGPTSLGLLDGSDTPAPSFVVMRKKQPGSSNDLKRQSAS